MHQDCDEMVNGWGRGRGDGEGGQLLQWVRTTFGNHGKAIVLLALLLFCRAVPEQCVEKMCNAMVTVSVFVHPLHF